MIVIDGVAYAEERSVLLKIVGIKPLDDYCLWLRFSNDEQRLYDIKPLFVYPVFEPLKDLDTFRTVYLDYGVPTWCDGEIDLAPETLYENSSAYKQTA